MGRRAVVGVVAVGVLAGIGGAVSCRQIVGFSDSEPLNITPTSVCGLPYGTATCAACAQTSCCGESSACATDSLCSPYFQCLGECTTGDWGCRSQCLLDHPVGASPLYAPLTACMARDCQVECGLTCGGIDYFAPPDAAAECQGCLGTTDCAAERACASSVECVAYAQCLHTCWTPDCRLACATATDGGWIDPDAGVNAARVPYASVIDPTATCNTACAVGNNWTCLGHVSWPMVTTGGTTLTTTVIDQLGSAPVVGAEVSLCRFTDPTCSAPIKSAISDQNGNVTLDIPGTVLGIGSDDYVQITSPDGNVVPTLDFLGYPVSRPRAPIAEPYATVLSPTELTTLASLLGIDAGLASIYGIAAFEVFDCNGLPSPGATVSIEPMAPQAVPFILTPGETPTTTATATTSIGVGGFAAVPPGTVTLTATPQGMRESSSRAQLLVRAGTDSIIYLFPTT